MANKINSSRKIVALPTLGKVGINFYCASEKVVNLYERLNEFERQKTIRHLGLISNVFEGASHTRYEYLMLQAALTDLIDNVHKGSATASQGEIKINGKGYKGNGLIKSWFLLSNLGHARNTIGDEKSLLLFAIKQRGFRNHLLRPIRDTQLKEWSNSVIDEFQYTNFHHILSIRRIYKDLFRQIEEQDYFIQIYKLLLLSPDNITPKIDHSKLEQLKRLFSTVRGLSIVTIDGHYSHSPISCDLISTVLSADSVENSYKNRSLLDSIKPLLSTLHETLYLDREVLALQREYEVYALELLDNCPKTASSYENSIQKAQLKGLIKIKEGCFKHFSRLPISQRINPQTTFYSEFCDYLEVKKGCPGVDASLDRNPITGQKYADFIIDSKYFTTSVLPRFVFNICAIIRGQIKRLVASSGTEIRNLNIELKNRAKKEGIDLQKFDRILKSSRKTMGRIAWVAFKKEIFPSYKDLFWSILSHFIKDSYHIDIEIQNKQYDYFGMRFPKSDVGFLKGNIEQAIEEEKDDKNRVFELKHLFHASKRKYDGYIFVCLAQIKIYDLTKQPGERKVTDIDSSVIKAGEDKLIIELNESKNNKRKREKKAKVDLKKKLVPVLNEYAKGYRITEVKGYGAKLVIKCQA
jgi:hypothetical protein